MLLRATIAGVFLLTASAIAAEISIQDSSGQDTILYRSSHALVIGAADYESRSWNDLPRVPAEIDEVVTALKDQGFSVERLLDPDSDKLRDAIRDFITEYGMRSENADNRLLIFFSGHGHTRPNDRGYLVPIDAPDPYQDETGFLRKAYDMADMMNWAEKIEAKHALFIFDSCFSGTLFQTKSRPNLGEVYIRDRTSKPVRQFITAGGADQEVPAASIFTPLFIRALKGEANTNSDTYVTGAELGLFLEQQLPNYNPAQKPQYGKIRDPRLDQGDFVFRIRPDGVRLDWPKIEEALNLRQEEQRAVQQALAELGFDPRGTDGKFGQKTRAAIANWQGNRSDEPTGYLTREQYEALIQFSRPAVAATGPPAANADEPLIISGSLKEAFEEYKKEFNPGHFAISEDGQFAAWTTCPEVKCAPGSRQQALALCQSKSGEIPCKIFAAGHAIVWDGPVKHQ